MTFIFSIYFLSSHPPPPLKKQKKYLRPAPYELLDTRLHGGIHLANMVMGDLRTCRLGAKKGLMSAN